MSSLAQLRAHWGHAPLMMVGVSLLLQDEQGRVLLQQRGDDGLWGTPGGAVEEGEDFLAAAARELLEETGLSCPDLQLYPLEAGGLVSGPQLYHLYPNGDEVYMVGARVSGRLPSTALQEAAPDNSGETLRLDWFDLGHLPPLSGNINRENMNVLRGVAGLPLLAMQDVPTPPQSELPYAQRLRQTGIPFFVPAVQVGQHFAELVPGQKFEDVARQLAGGPVRAREVSLSYGEQTWQMVAEFELL